MMPEKEGERVRERGMKGCQDEREREREREREIHVEREREREREISWFVVTMFCFHGLLLTLT